MSSFAYIIIIVAILLFCTIFFLRFRRNNNARAWMDKHEFSAYTACPDWEELFFKTVNVHEEIYAA